MRKGRKKTLVRAALLGGACFLVLLLMLFLADSSWKSQFGEESRSAGTQEFMEEGTVTWEGKRYRKKPGMRLILLAGIDQEDQAPSPRVNYRNGGQADFLLLLAIDHQNGEIRQLQIDRDTMAQVMVLGVYGNETGTRELQICLAHSFGATREDNAKYTLRAVRDLMGGLEITDYYTVDYGAVPVLADALGGVPVRVPEDMTTVNPAWTEGAAVTLLGGEAETFVRTRKTVGEGTNAERMTRQGIFLSAAIEKLNQGLGEQKELAGSILSALKPWAATNLSELELLEMINQSHVYKVMPIDRLPGTYTLSEDGFVEFYPEKGAAERWVMENLYREI